ncbi:unnamed protein product [Symbiodinium microadriaticum]|nr:unnamed protein product [Symbiodinium sp. KB8]CAE7880612.1 unnamed protein product [Symbiodinium microadriaticum]
MTPCLSTSCSFAIGLQSLRRSSAGFVCKLPHRRDCDSDDVSNRCTCRAREPAPQFQVEAAASAIGNAGLRGTYFRWPERLEPAQRSDNAEVAAGESRRCSRTGSERFEQRFAYPPQFDTKKDESTLKWLSRVNNGPQEVLGQAEAGATAAPLQGPELLYRCDMELSDQLIDLVDAFEQAPSARGGHKHLQVIVAKMVYLQVYPVTEADDSAPSEPGLKGKAIGKASGARGCDCQFVCVRGHPPQGKHKNRHYLACKHGERPEATEIVISQEIRLLPEYVVKVEVTNDGELCKRIQVAAENWGRYASSDADSSAEAASSTDDSNQKHKMELRRRLNETEKT